MSTFELLSIIGSIVATGIALGAVVIGGIASLRTDIRALDIRLSALETRLSAVEQRLARVEGLVEVLRDAVLACGFRKPRDEQDET